MAISQRTADVTYSFNNLSILSVTSLSVPTTERVAVSDLFIAFETILGPVNSTLDPESANAQLITQLAEVFSLGHVAGYDLEGSFASILGLPFLIFQQNFLNPNASDELTEPEPGFAPELYVSVDLSETIIIGTIPHWTVIVYIALSFAVLLPCIVGIYLALLVQGPVTSSFTMVDFASRIPTSDGQSTLSNILAGLANADDDELQLKLADKGLFLRDIGSHLEVESGQPYRSLGLALEHKAR
jgi:hypothetical protein